MLQGPLTERPWEHIPDTFGQVEDISDALIAREQNAFLLADNAGNIVPGTRRGYGLYFWDMIGRKAPPGLEEDLRRWKLKFPVMATLQ